MPIVGSLRKNPGANFSAAGLGNLSFTAEEIALAADTALLTWLSANPLWQLPAAGSTNGAPADRQGTTIFTKTGLSSGTGINGKNTFVFAGGAFNAVSSTSPVIPVAGDWTVSLVGKPAAGAVSQFVVGSATGSYFGLNRNASNQIEVYFNAARISAMTYSAGWATTARHVQLCYTQSTKLVSLMVDGVVRSSATAGADLTETSFEIGDALGSAASWNGDIAAAMVWNVDLSTVANAARQATLRTHITSVYAVA